MVFYSPFCNFVIFSGDPKKGNLLKKWDRGSAIMHGENRGFQLVTIENRGLSYLSICFFSYKAYEYMIHIFRYFLRLFGRLTKEAHA